MVSPRAVILARVLMYKLYVGAGLRIYVLE